MGKLKSMSFQIENTGFNPVDENRPILLSRQIMKKICTLRKSVRSFKFSEGKSTIHQ